MGPHRGCETWTAARNSVAIPAMVGTICHGGNSQCVCLKLSHVLSMSVEAIGALAFLAFWVES